MKLKQFAGTVKSLAFALAATLSLSVSATDYYWIGGASGNWNDGSNWSLTEGGSAASAFPTTGDSATVSSQPPYIL